MEVSNPSASTLVPANAVPKRVTEATRVPMSLPTTKLSVPELPGFYLYWHLGKNINAALRAGYSFVDDEEVDIEQHNTANDAAASGSTDMGSRISVSAGRNQFDEQGQPERLYLMKLPIEWRRADEAALAQVNEGVAQRLRAGGDAGDPDANRRYMKAGQDLFYPKVRK